nr:hypothetical protein [uncultured Moraxella sp.]
MERQSLYQALAKFDENQLKIRASRAKTYLNSAKRGKALLNKALETQ